MMCVVSSIVFTKSEDFTKNVHVMAMKIVIEAKPWALISELLYGMKIPTILANVTPILAVLKVST